MSGFREEMVRQLNIARKDPKSLIPDVSSGNFSSISKTETIAFLNGVKPCTTTIVGNTTLDKLAQSYAEKQGVSGEIGHDDFTSRISSLIPTLSPLGENISYGYTSNYVPGNPIPSGYFVVDGYNSTMTITTTKNGVTTTSTIPGGTTLQKYLLSPREVVVALIVDEGVPSRGHRDNLYNCTFNQVGIGIAPNKDYRVEVVNIYGTAK
jgi:uncharacterized protein YkwD